MLATESNTAPRIPLLRVFEIEPKDQAMLESLSTGYEEGKEKYIGFLAALSLKRHFLSVALQKPSDCHYEASARILLCEIEIPDFAEPLQPTLSAAMSRFTPRKRVTLSGFLASPLTTGRMRIEWTSSATSFWLLWTASFGGRMSWFA
ncbi:hypothetical protein [Bradyrhizobium canariense]|uniref:hypothetical protein n=1 Tax=Bradyrhizobium canariense TaxID=255045 RepID=UPI00117781C8|nr:hypothetical protein [Bradyrhizobium canariense]